MSTARFLDFVRMDNSAYIYSTVQCQQCSRQKKKVLLRKNCMMIPILFSNILVIIASFTQSLQTNFVLDMKNVQRKYVKNLPC